MSATDTLKPAASMASAASGQWGRWLAWFRAPLVLIGVLISLYVVLYAWWIHPTTMALSGQEAHSQEIRRQVQALLLYQDQRHRLDALTRRFPSKKALPQAIGRISALGQRAGVSIPGMNFQPAQTASPKWAKITLQFDAHGPYAGVRRLVAALEGATEPFVLESMTMEKDKQTGQVVARLIVSVYARDE